MIIKTEFTVSITFVLMLLYFVGLNMKSVNKSTYEMFGPQSEYESEVNATYKDISGYF